MYPDASSSVQLILTDADRTSLEPGLNTCTCWPGAGVGQRVPSDPDGRFTSHTSHSARTSTFLVRSSMKMKEWSDELPPM
jgi:hypothetical protein